MTCKTDPTATTATPILQDYAGLRASGRTPWIRERRAPRPAFDVHIPHNSFVEVERTAAGALLPTLTILLRSRECPWHCLMCDLWKSTVSQPIPPGAIPAQIDRALDDAVDVLPGSGPSQVKLYNSGSFFDVGAVPPGDYPAIAQRLQRFERVIVECHPKLVGHRTLEFRNRLAQSPAPGDRLTSASVQATPIPQLEVAMGLETIHPVALERLNKGMSLDDFRRAADLLRQHQIGLRAFVLVQPPFVPEAEAIDWAEHSAQFAFDCGATAVSLIPTRTGNGALDDLARSSHFSPPTLKTFERAVDRTIALSRGRVFGDLWDLERFSSCPSCFSARRERLAGMNRDQVVKPEVACRDCACGCSLQ